MKKALFFCDGKDFPTQMFNFVKTLYQKEPFLLTGAFFHTINYSSLVPSTFAANPDSFLALTKEESNYFEKAVDQFKTLCQQHDIEYRVHKETLSGPAKTLHGKPVLLT